MSQSSGQPQFQGGQTYASPPPAPTAPYDWRTAAVGPSNPGGNAPGAGAMSGAINGALSGMQGQGGAGALSGVPGAVYGSLTGLPQMSVGGDQYGMPSPTYGGPPQANPQTNLMATAQGAGKPNDFVGGMSPQQAELARMMGYGQQSQAYQQKALQTAQNAQPQGFEQLLAQANGFKGGPTNIYGTNGPPNTNADYQAGLARYMGQRATNMGVEAPFGRNPQTGAPNSDPLRNYRQERMTPGNQNPTPWTGFNAAPDATQQSIWDFIRQRGY